ncbi:MAG: acetate--CoA ligase [Proteobacteria bacterium]|nr:acetate--CoA ligase [Pseudomonadota bacterium]
MSIYEVPARVREGSPNPMTSLDSYNDLAERVSADPDAYWVAETCKRVSWRTEPTQGVGSSFDDIAEHAITWFADGTLNATESCLDRHLETRGDKVAILWEGDDVSEGLSWTYKELHEQVCLFSNAMKARGIVKGDRVLIYMGMVPEAAVAMLACARIGAIHSVVFGGFSADSLRSRAVDCRATAVITQDFGMRGGKRIELKRVSDQALIGLDSVHTVFVYKRTEDNVDMQAGRDHWWHEAIADESPDCPAEIVDAEHPLFILYTSGSTGKPKGQVHTHGGYITWTSYTHQHVFDLREDDVYACVADVGWITGHSYIVYGPLANGATTLMFESIPTYPDAGRYWDMVERHKISIFYTAPTAIRALAAQGDHFVTRYDRSSLRVLGTVGEPINPDAWEWYHRVVGEGRCNIVDTWWQTETGGICISPIAPATPTKPGSATLPVPGIEPVLRDAEGQILNGEAEGLLCIRRPWPGMSRTIWGDHDRYVDTYFSMFPGAYFTGDGCRRDADGYHWITGRVDDVINVSGHRMGTAEFESALVHHNAVAEAGVVGFPHPIKGQGVYCYIVLAEGHDQSETLERDLQNMLRSHIGAHARVDLYQVVPGLPKTRSGKVMRRILRKVAEGQPDALGDISTLADPTVVEAIIAGARSLD